MAKEYIEREAAKNAIYEYICGHTMSKFPSGELLDASKKGAEGAMYSLDDVPTADVVEVVRCKDCIRYVDNREACVTYCTRGLRNIDVMPDDFCSHGERKEK